MTLKNRHKFISCWCDPGSPLGGRGEGFKLPAFAAHDLCARLPSPPMKGRPDDARR
jgi:hypothetical protein